MTEKFMSMEEFVESGYLQEVNRRFLHPLGLALEAVYDDLTEEWSLGRIRDNREDQIGFVFKEINKEKADRIQEEWIERSVTRLKNLGFSIQPIE